ncbi:MAG: hypothetical protein WAW09_04770 [Smithella sp.]|jgi:hypothetical protein|nr:hypothetical protein [Chloroflexota bacterium]
MGKSMYNFGKNTKEKARQLKQMEKAAKRLAAKQNKANIELTTPDQDSDTMESSQLKEVL